MRKFALSLAALALIASPALAGKYNKKVSVGDKAPTFSGLAASTPKGEEASVSLQDLKEDVVVLVFQANHCPAVIACEDRVNDLATSFKGKSVKVVGIAVSGKGTRSQDDIAAIKEKAKSDKGFSYTYAYDETMDTGRAYGVVATPTFFVLDKDRKIVYYGLMDDSVMSESKVSKTYVKDAVEAALSGKAPEVTETSAQGCGISYDKK
jgi:peroxiredoxin